MGQSRLFLLVQLYGSSSQSGLLLLSCYSERGWLKLDNYCYVGTTL
ncbi:hypothetical protein SLEP1_g26305 [Rubroshorea leprosula]|uniref:Uncharacterized protein n=1 Tax=Rubroshorea leprosula TaxID=152421 RepID=A0AAV5JLP4_9ROSI|nr:hypothetical protein SLEP1_g26305 [Rubroshorea leprosula]